jgi:hypothetical protein
MSKRKRPGKKHPTPNGTYVFRCQGGVLTVKITEHEDHVSVLIGGKHNGPLPPRVDKQFDRWMMPLLEPYEDDERPLWIDHEDGNRRALVQKTKDKLLVVQAERVTAEHAP